MQKQRTPVRVDHAAAAAAHDDGTGDLHRVRKDSFFEYQRVIASNGEDLG